MYNIKVLQMFKKLWLRSEKTNICNGQLPDSVSFKLRLFGFLKTLEQLKDINWNSNIIWNLVMCIDHDQKRPLRCRNWMISHASTTDIHVNGLPQGRTKRRYCRMTIYVFCNKHKEPSINDVSPLFWIYNPPPSPCWLRLLNRLMW